MFILLTNMKGMKRNDRIIESSSIVITLEEGTLVCSLLCMPTMVLVIQVTGSMIYHKYQNLQTLKSIIQNIAVFAVFLSVDSHIF